MSEKTNIQYADHTFNPWIGCSKVSAGCANCYAERSMPAKMFGVKWGQPETYHLSKSWDAPLRWQREAKQWCDSAEVCKMAAPKVMVSLCDWLDPDVSIEWLARFLDMIRRTPNLVWLLLTKRIEWFHGRLHAVCEDGAMKESAEVIDFVSRWKSGHKVPQNVAIGVSVEDQKTADERIPKLLRIPAWRRWVSAEPLLGPIEFGAVPGGMKPPIYQDQRIKIDWIAVGGESWPRARPCNVEWIRSIVQQCKASVPCFVKQVGTLPIVGPCQPDGALSYSRLSVKHPKGSDAAEWPEDMRVSEEMP